MRLGLGTSVRFGGLHLAIHHHQVAVHLGLTGFSSAHGRLQSPEALLAD